LNLGTGANEKALPQKEEKMKEIISWEDEPKGPEDGNDGGWGGPAKK
jgi:hypothetical protein